MATLAKLRPGREVKISALQANGIVECKRLLQDALCAKPEANFLEGMGCRGGCVGGPKAIADSSHATRLVIAYAAEAHYYTPQDNKFSMRLLASLGIHDVDEFLDGKKAEMFTRDFGEQTRH